MPKKDDHLTRRLFRDPSGQMAMFDKSYEEELEERASRPVECLGMTFPNDAARRAYFVERLREHLQDPAFRAIEGFPIGADEDILALSDPPYYTACPNPFLGEFIRLYGKPYDPATDDYHREPFAADVSEGKNDPIYQAHTYHTKVPPRAIMHYLQHYTSPGDVVLDAFCGTGMTGVAAALCAEPRHVVLGDLSPAASFLAYNFAVPAEAGSRLREQIAALRDVTNDYGWMYETSHPVTGQVGSVNYVVWSDVFYCPNCGADIVFWDCAVDKHTYKVLESFECPTCGTSLQKRLLTRIRAAEYDSVLGKTVLQAQRVPVLVHFYVGNKAYTKRPSKEDMALLAQIQQASIPEWVPSDRLPDGDKTSDPASVGVTHVHHFYTRRNLICLASFAAKIGPRRKAFNVTSVATGATLMYRFRSQGGSLGAGGGPMNGTLYVPSLSKEIPVTKLLGEHLEKTARMRELISEYRGNIVQTASHTSLSTVPDSSVDYVFTDPPFGGNLMYSELNFLWESWLRVHTQTTSEAIINTHQRKGLAEYQLLMTRSFRECHRAMKPGRWVTIVFHNSRNAVWNAIQEGLTSAGFVVADVRTLDKRQRSFNAANAAGAVQQDLVISAYKPNGGLEERFRLEAGSEEGAWDFTRTHLRQLPVFVAKEGRAEVIAERQSYLLYDRMVAFHVQRGITVPLSASEFYAGLAQRFPERDGMFFLPDQAAEYDRKRLTVREVLQLQLIVTDESSAIQWLRQQLTERPQTFQELHPQFLREIGGWSRNEKPLELSTLLEQSFLRYDDLGAVPSQVHSYLSSNYKELRNLPKDDPALRAKGKDRWYVPDPNKAGDLEKLRERALLREFDEYVASTQRRLRVFRLEAVRAGFRRAWQARDYATIIAVAEKIPEAVLQEDPKLLMWYDQAVTRSGG
jgi:hypothetical protein